MHDALRAGLGTLFLASALAACGGSESPGTGAGAGGAGGGGGAAAAGASAAGQAGSQHDAGSEPRLPSCPEATISTTSGCLQPVQYEGYWALRGVRYAMPPIGELRWKPPQPLAASDEVQSAHSFGKACPQLNPTLGGEQLAWDEDCLFLNVFSPSLEPAAKRPIMVWIHGGGLHSGSASQAVYSGQYLATLGDVVVVTINYRLAQLGFLAHPALSAEDSSGKSGNYGLRDQIAALTWVRDNALALGGDPDNVTIFGESAGGLSVCALLATPKAAGLFHRAIMQSAACPDFGGYARSLTGGPGESAEEQGLRVATELGCQSGDVAACLRSKPPEVVLSALKAAPGLLDGGERYGFSVDGELLPDSPAKRVLEGKHTIVPTLSGTTADEGSVFIAATPMSTWVQFAAWVKLLFGASATTVQALYPASKYGTPKLAFSALVTHYTFTCPTRRRAIALSKTSAGTRLYRFSQVTPLGASLDLGAWHGSEIEFVFGTVRERVKPPSAAELSLSDQMLGYWTAFARSGDPNAGAAGVAIWPKYDATTDQHQELAVPVASGSQLNTAECDVFDAL